MCSFLPVLFEQVGVLMLYLQFSRLAAKNFKMLGCSLEVAGIFDL
jgi:hypothetical protein